MNYRHSYHAGNFADVVKHVLVLQLISMLQAKPKGLRIIDAYAGRGVYSLRSEEAKKTAEFADGVGKLAPDPAAPEALCNYFELLEACKSEFGASYYPGSPWLISQRLRSVDELHAFELLESEAAQLKSLFAGLCSVNVHHRAAQEGTLALTPPPTGRGLVLIDPPFEQEHKDFSQLVDQLIKLHKRWPMGVFALWYPIKRRDVVELFEKKMRRSSIKNQLITELGVLPSDVPMGMTGTGMLIINPPWKFAEHADQILQYLKPKLEREAGQGYATVRWLVGE